MFVSSTDVTRAKNSTVGFFVWLFIALFLLGVATLSSFGADGSADAGTAGAMPHQVESQISLWMSLIPFLCPMVVSLVKRVIPKIPKLWLPVICALLGAVHEIIFHYSGLNTGGTAFGLALGAAGVCVREVLDQFKQEKNVIAGAGLIFACLLLIGSQGCATYEGNAYRVIGATTVTVEKCMAGWNDYVGAGKASIEDELKVHAIYERYQKAMRVAKASVMSYRANQDKSSMEIALGQLESTGAEVIKFVRAVTDSN